MVFEKRHLTVGLRHWKLEIKVAVDVVMVLASYFFSFFIKFPYLSEGVIGQWFWPSLALVVAVKISCLFLFRVYRGFWRYASLEDLLQIIKAVGASSLALFFLFGEHFRNGFPQSVLAVDAMFFLLSLAGIRFAYRYIHQSRLPQQIFGEGDEEEGVGKRVIIYGAGDAGEMLLRDFKVKYKNRYEIVGLVDDAPFKKGKSIHRINILGTGDDLFQIAKQNHIDEIIIAIPSLKKHQMRAVVERCLKSGVHYRTLPNISEVMNGNVGVKELREVKLEDLLGRPAIRLDRSSEKQYIQGKRVLVTGAGGSIGSEICRQVAMLEPEELVLFERYENSLYFVDLELQERFPKLKKTVIVGDVCDKKRVNDVFAKYKPHVVFHAAAYKHVPLMELNPYEALRNNAYGMVVLGEAALAHHVEKVILLSTDKAVNPENAMGVSKRIAELYVNHFGDKFLTKFVAVRFGNVLGSDGSVIPLFKKQLERGGPLTVTHPDIKRFFMSIPEAVQLVLKAGFLGKGSEIFVLDMGEQIKVMDIANDLIRLSGLEPGVDIAIKVTGLRPGEKMEETLLGDNEKLSSTEIEKISLLKSEGLRKDFEIVLKDFVRKIEEEADIAEVLMVTERFLPDYQWTKHLPVNSPAQKVISDALR